MWWTAPRGTPTMSALGASTTRPPPRPPHDLLLGRPHHDAARQLPAQASGQHHPPLVELAVPVRAVAAPGRAGDQRHELALVGDDALRPRRRSLLVDDL